MNSIRETTSKRICDHMNKDHKEEVNWYLTVHLLKKYHGNITTFKEAELLEITSNYMRIGYNGESVEVIDFDKEIFDHIIIEEINNAFAK